MNEEYETIEESIDQLEEDIPEDTGNQADPEETEFTPLIPDAPDAEDNIQISTTALISEILIGDRHRAAGDTKQLEYSIKDFGLVNPITLRANPDYEAGIETTTATKPYILVAGLNRLTAHKNLGLLEIPANVRSMSAVAAEMLEIDENLARTDLSTLERVTHLKRRKELYNLKYNITQGKTPRDESGNKVPRFDEEAADVSGMAASSIREAVNLANKLDPAVTDLLAGTKTANNQSELARLAGVDKPVQAPIAEIIKNSSVPITVAEAQMELRKTEPLVPEPILESQDEKFEKNLLAAEGKLRFAERTLREDIDIGETWTTATQLDFRDHIHNMMDVLNKIQARFDVLLDGEEPAE